MTTDSLPFSPEQLKSVDHAALAKSLIASGHCTRFVVGLLPEWRPFFQKHRAELPDMENNLKNGLDEESCRVIHFLVQCYHLLLTAEESVGKRIGRYDLLINGDFFLTDFETDWKRAIEAGAALPWERETEKYMRYEKFQFPENIKNTLDPVQMRLCFGLKFIPPELINLREKDVIDGGAYVGDSALVFSDFSPRKVYAFEPHPQAFQSLQEVLRLNHRENDVVAVPLALGEDSGSFPFYADPDCDCGAGFRVQENKAVFEVSRTSIDEYVRRYDLRPGLIKLDTEGHEFETIRGAVETIRKFKPILLVGINHRPVDFFGIKPFLEKMDLGYKFFFRRTAVENPNGEISLVAHV